MATSRDDAGGAQPGKLGKPGSPGKQPSIAARKGRLDGITKMSGTITFGATSVSLTVTIDPVGGEGTSFSALGNPGNSIGTQAATSASRGGDVVTASGLNAAIAGTNYTVQVRYTSGNAACSKTGTVAGSNVRTGPASVTLT